MAKNKVQQDAEFSRGSAKIRWDHRLTGATKQRKLLELRKKIYGEN